MGIGGVHAGLDRLVEVVDDIALGVALSGLWQALDERCGPVGAVVRGEGVARLHGPAGPRAAPPEPSQCAELRGPCPGFIPPVRSSRHPRPRLSRRRVNRSEEPALGPKVFLVPGVAAVEPLTSLGQVAALGELENERVCRLEGQRMASAHEPVESGLRGARARPGASAPSFEDHRGCLSPARSLGAQSGALRSASARGGPPGGRARQRAKPARTDSSSHSRRAGSDMNSRRSARAASAISRQFRGALTASSAVPGRRRWPRSAPAPCRATGRRAGCAAACDP